MTRATDEHEASLGRDPAWRALAAVLQSRLSAVEAEIREYPAPIPACDAQFNDLLEQRSGIPRELARLRREMRAGSGPDAFVASCPYLEPSDIRRSSAQRASLGAADRL